MDDDPRETGYVLLQHDGHVRAVEYERIHGGPNRGYWLTWILCPGERRHDERRRVRQTQTWVVAITAAVGDALREIEEVGDGPCP